MAKFLLVRNCSFEKLLPTDLDCSFVVMVPCAMYLWVELQASDIRSQSSQNSAGDEATAYGG